MPTEPHPVSPAPAVVIADTGAVASHVELARRAADLHALFHELGLSAGDTVALLSRNRLELFEVERATRRAGLLFVSVDPIWTIEETAYVVNDSGAQVIFTSAERGARAVEIAPLTPYVHARFCFDGETPGHMSYADALTVTREHPEPTPTATRLFYSAGTFGRPYGIRRRGLLATLLGDRLTLSPVTRLFSASPLSDAVGSQLYCAVLDAGGTVVTFSTFSPGAAESALAEHSPTIGHVLPIHLMRVMKAGLHEDVSGLDTIVVSSAPCPPDAMRWLINAVGPGVVEVYGNTDRDAIAVISAEEWLAHPGSVGRPDNGVELPPRDRGRFDDDGYFYARDEVREVKDVLAVHRKVADAAIVTVPDESGGVELRAVVVPQQGERPGQGLERELIDYVRGRKPQGPRLHRVDFVESLPRSASGRLVRRRLASRFAMSDGMLV